MAWRVSPSDYKQLTNGEIAAFHDQHARNIERIEQANRRR